LLRHLADECGDDALALEPLDDRRSVHEMSRRDDVLRSNGDRAKVGTPPREEEEMARYLLAVNFEGGVVETPMEEWKPEEITAHLDYYKALHRELVGNGELVESEVLTGPDLAKIVTSDGATAPVITDGPFQEFKEWLAGYQIVDVPSEARAIEIAAKLSAVPGPDGVALQQPIQVRQVMEQAPSDAAEMDAFLQQVGGEH
jgi:hypothetical protein